MEIKDCKYFIFNKKNNNLCLNAIYKLYLQFILAMLELFDFLLFVIIVRK